MGPDGSDTNRPARLGRRTFVKALGAAGATAVGLSHDHGFAQDAEAIAPLVGAGLVAGSVGVGWALREFEVVGSNAPAEGLAPDALKQQVYQTARTRKSTNASTIVDNQNIVDGIRHTAYTDAKTAALEQLNAGASESDVLDAAKQSIDKYQTTIQENLLKTWNESVREIDAMNQRLEAHPDLSKQDALQADNTESGNMTEVQVSEVTVNLANGNGIAVKQIDWGSAPDDWDPANPNNPVVEETGETKWRVVAEYDNNTISYMRSKDWNGIWDSIQSTFTDVRSGIETWVTSVYGDVQSGSIKTSDLVTPRDRASMMPEGEGSSQAVADLIALNTPVDPEREATITIKDTGATMSGTFALTDSSDGPLEAGNTYNPSTFAGDVYFTTDISLVEGNWSAINSGVDGGVITITSEPYEGTAIEVTTVASETVSVPAADWTDNGDGTWSYDASDDLETAITNVDTARFVSTATETQYETLQLDGSFTVEKLVNTQSGEEVTTTNFKNSEPQTDSNYVTQEEWDQLEQQNKELIEKYENSQSGGGIDLGQFDMFGLPGEMVVVCVAAVIGFLTLND
ncbi:twin-arginine translocation signal domain-containing protein [Halorubrum ezzemoulense]|uniref:twin-arginine translocation signal domain-containing protein n=1 Tax=Halorubrum ezzemoulense TaxID=337243 RepID=UPI00232B78AC|nr:twin-arginine translocation signal domain-containing protein [Halorubrum ezzemoulense]MDB9280521.1 twin-arginine translocation signal domain-containing protein [Halorubrum ezzemoulense]MDB9284300.1 twin-arginine translocation signal domain-containing protein [Halorubrum ezzemoulense]